MWRGDKIKAIVKIYREELDKLDVSDIEILFLKHKCKKRKSIEDVYLTKILGDRLTDINRLLHQYQPDEEKYFIKNYNMLSNIVMLIINYIQKPYIKEEVMAFLNKYLKYNKYYLLNKSKIVRYPYELALSVIVIVCNYWNYPIREDDIIDAYDINKKKYEDIKNDLEVWSKMFYWQV